MASKVLKRGGVLGPMALREQRCLEAASDIEAKADAQGAACSIRRSLFLHCVHGTISGRREGIAVEMDTVPAKPVEVVGQSDWSHVTLFWK